MEVIIQPTAEEASRLACDIVLNLVLKKENAVLGLATGSTPLRLYKEMVRAYKEFDLDFSKLTTFNLDEYIGLPKSHAQSYHSFMHENLFRHINIPASSIHIPNGLADDIEGYCYAYEDTIRKAGGIDLQILGIGSDGHIGFNEPTSSLGSRTRIKTLTQQTLKDNARFFNNDPNSVPKHCITMGIGTILDSRCCLLMAFGKNKADAVAATVEGPITSMIPASALQFHRHTVLLLDEDAASKLEHRQYYNWVYDNKPAWQMYKLYRSQH